MIKATLRLICLVMVLAFSIGNVCFADIPDIHGGHRRPIPPPPPIQYQITTEAHNANYSENQLAITLYYVAPEGAQVDYVVEADNNSISTKASDTTGKLLLVLDKPKVGESYTVSLKTSCYQTMVYTKFGMKKTQTPELIGSWDCNYKLTGEKNGYVEIERSN